MQVKRLLIIFAGWGMDENPFRDIHRPDYEIKVVYDYRHEPKLPTDYLKSFSEICVVAWSFGVPAATRFILNHQDLPITAKIAVNGTLYPVDDQKGIPENIFLGTLQNLSAETLHKFYRRMCGSKDRLADYLTHAPKRPIDELADELRAIQTQPTIESDKTIDLWSTVFISQKDLIIPTANQITAWSGHQDIRLTPGSHLPDFATIIDTCIPNKQLISERFGSAAHTYDTNTPVQSDMALMLANLWSEHITDIHPDNVIEIGCGTGKFTTEMLRYLTPRHLTLYDISPINPNLPGIHLCLDGELAIRTIADDSIDTIASSATIQWFSSTPDFITQAHRTLHSGGQLVLGTFAPGHFAEINDLLPSPIHYLSTERWLGMLDGKFRINTITEDSTTLHFDNPAALLKHLRDTGVNALKPSVSAARGIINQNICSLTYRPLYIIATKV